MFKNVFVEEQVKSHTITKNILSQVKRDPVYIKKIEDYFGRYQKPYLQKRTTLNLFVGKKEGELIKKTPPAYGAQGAPHYYFVHAYNCIYECQYCYLQGYFKSPDLVLYVNHEEITDQIKSYCNQIHKNEKEVWFHSGEFSDSLALSYYTNEFDQYWKTFSELKNGYLELRTKSVNIRHLLERKPLANIVPSYSLASEKAIHKFDLKTPSLKARLQSIEKLQKHGYQVGLHFDPVIYLPSVLEDYSKMFDELVEFVNLDQVAYISLGVVRFSRDSYQSVLENYPESDIHKIKFEKAQDKKMRYPRALRESLRDKIYENMRAKGVPENLIYHCMDVE